MSDSIALPADMEKSAIARVTPTTPRSPPIRKRDAKAAEKRAAEDREAGDFCRDECGWTEKYMDILLANDKPQARRKAEADLFNEISLSYRRALLREQVPPK